MQVFLQARQKHNQPYFPTFLEKFSFFDTIKL